MVKERYKKGKGSEYKQGFREYCYMAIPKEALADIAADRIARRVADERIGR